MIEVRLSILFFILSAALGASSQAQHKEFTSITAARANPLAVKTLILKNQGLTELPEDISRMVNLEKLNISGNKLTHLPKGLFTLKKLKSLNVAANKLGVVPPDIAQLKNLEELDIGFN